jgi:hypothetical protein
MEVTGSKQEASGTQRGRPSSALLTRASRAQESPFGFSPFSLVRRLMEGMDRMLEEFRIIPLPEGADVDHPSARFDNGVLEVSVPLSAQAQRRRRIEIQGASSGAQAKRPEGQTAVH